MRPVVEHRRAHQPIVPWPRTALGIVVVATAVVLGFGFVIRGDTSGLAVDAAFRRWVVSSFDVYTRNDMVAYTDRPAIIVIAVVTAVFAAVGRRYDIATLAVAAPLVATGITEYVLKPFFDRSVPLVARLTGVEAKAYPSGHETAVSSVLAVLALLTIRARMPRWVKVVVLLALTAYYAVTVCGLVGQYFHYLTDTIGALFVASAVVLGGALVLDRVPRLRAG